MNERPRDDVWPGFERRMAHIERLVPPTPAWLPDGLDVAPTRVRVVRGPAFEPTAPKYRASRRRLAFVLVAVGLALAIAGGALLATGAYRRLTGQLDGLIAYVGAAGDFGLGDVHVAQPDGSHDRIVSTPSSPGACPAFSPDGSKLGYWVAVEGDEQLIVMDPDGSAVHAIPATRHALGASPPIWAPDGTRVAYDTIVVEDLEIRVAPLDGGPSIVIVPTALKPTNIVSWSPDGVWIAFVGGWADPAIARTGIYLVHPDGSGLHEVAAIPAIGATVSWSPDGRRLAYTHDDQVWVIGTDGSGPTALTDATMIAFEPRWSPDGSRVGFTGSMATPPDPEGVVGGPAWVGVVRLDGSAPVILADGSFDGDWSPDGTALAYRPAGAPHAPYTLAVLRLSDPTRPTQVAPLIDPTCVASWQVTDR